MKTGDKINRLRTKTAWTKTKLAEMIGARNSSLITHWEKNRFKPSVQNMQKIAEAFGTTVSELADDEDASIVYDGAKGMYETSFNSGAPHGSMIGILGSAYSEGFFLNLSAPPEGYLPVLLENDGVSKPFAIKIEGSRIYGSARPGDYALIMPLQEVAEGKLALIRYAGQLWIKQLFSREDSVLMKDGKKQTKAARARVEVLGQVVGFFHH